MNAFPAYSNSLPPPGYPTATNARPTARTPSPTPSEIEALNQKSMFNFKSAFNKEKMFTKKYIMYYVVGIVAIVIGALFIFYHNQIVRAIQPAATWMHNVPGGFMIPIAIFFVISFPPLFGHEILAIVCGVVWGIGIGFAITAAGTLLGEIGNFYAFRYLLRKRLEKEEKKSIQYACLAKVIREGGFKIAVIVRYSAVPGHFTTAIFSVCGMNIFIFILAALLSMPKQFITVYIGTLLESDEKGGATSRNKLLSYVVGFVTIVVTFAAMWYIQREVNRVKPEVIYARRKERQAKLDDDTLYQNGGLAGSNEDAVFNPNTSDVALTTPFAQSDSPYDSPYQQWDRRGRAVGNPTDPRVYAPQPLRANASFDPALGSPSRAGSASGQTRQQSTDTARWALQTNAADGQAYPLGAISEAQPPVGPLQNPFENPTSVAAVAFSRSPPGRSSTGDYAFSANSSSRPTRAFSPPPPSYRV